MTIESVAKNGPAMAARAPKPTDGGTSATGAPVPRHMRRPQQQPDGQRPRPDAAPRKDAPTKSDAQRPRQDPRGERSLYDGGSPSANRLGPAKAMRARDVSRPRD